MNYVQRLLLRFSAALLIALLASLAVSSWFVLSAFERSLIPEIEGKSATLGRSLINLIGQASAQGVALDQLVGVKDVLLQVQKDNDEIGLISITNNEHKVIDQIGPSLEGLASYFSTVGQRGKYAPMQLVSDHYIVSMPIDVAEGRLGFLHIGAKQAFVQGTLKETMLDVMIVLIVTFFIAIEITYFFAGKSVVMQFVTLMRAVTGGGKGNFDYVISTPVQQSLGAAATATSNIAISVNAAYSATLDSFKKSWRARHPQDNQGLRQIIQALRALRSRYRFNSGDGEDVAIKLGLLRAPLFLALLADDFARAFLPMYATLLFAPIAGLSMQFVLGLPIVLFMLIVALSQPLLGNWSERIGRRKALLAGVSIGIVAHLGSAFAYSIYDLLLWRALAGLSWGIVFVAGQGYVLDHTKGRSRVKGLAFFVGVIMISSACGPSIGGILADGIGYRPTLFLSAILAAFSALLIWHRLPDDRSATASQRPTRLSDIVMLIRNRRFLVFLLTAAMPAKVILIACCFYLIPLYMPDIGSSSAMAGRLIMLYAIVMVIGIPLAARWSAEPRRRRLFVSAGLLVSGCAGLLPLVMPGAFGVAGLVLLLGAGQSLSIAPQTAMVAQLCAREILVLGESTVMGVYRLIERIGNVFGPVVAAILLQSFNFVPTFALIGGWVLSCGIIFFLTSRFAESISSKRLLTAISQHRPSGLCSK